MSNNPVGVFLLEFGTSITRWLRHPAPKMVQSYMPPRSGPPNIKVLTLLAPGGRGAKIVSKGAKIQSL